MKLNLNKKYNNFVKEMLMKLLKVADEIFHFNPKIKQPVDCPTITMKTTLFKYHCASDAYYVWEAVPKYHW